MGRMEYKLYHRFFELQYFIDLLNKSLKKMQDHFKTAFFCRGDYHSLDSLAYQKKYTKKASELEDKKKELQYLVDTYHFDIDDVY